MYKFFVLLLYSVALFANASNDPLVDIEKINPNILLDIRYATKNNFTGQVVYPKAKCFLRKSVALKLSQVQKDLEQKGLGLKIFDGYRPFSYQKKFWELFPDPRYVAKPGKNRGSNHNRGSAVDVTLVTREKKELAMPSEFDDFSKKAHRDFQDASAEAIKNRKILEDAMLKRGFVPLHEEWWHFDAERAKEYEILDIEFDEIDL